MFEGVTSAQIAGREAAEVTAAEVTAPLSEGCRRVGRMVSAALVLMAAGGLMVAF